MSDLVNAPAFWGLAGAFVYAGPNLTRCAFELRQETPRHFLECISNFTTCMLIGVIGAAVVAPLICEVRHLGSPRWLNAIAAVIGLIANKAAPLLIEFTPKFLASVLTTLKGAKDEPQS